MTDSAPERITTSPPITIEIRRARSYDAAGIVACFRRCYAETYPAEVFYDEAALEDALASGSRHAIVAVDGDRVVGHMANTVRHPGAPTAELGNTVVDPEYRGQHIMAHLGRALSALCRSAGYTGYVHYPTTAHAVMQHHSVADGGAEVGLMLGYIPAGTEYREIERTATGRLAATIAFARYAASPRTEVRLPAAHAELAAGLYRAAGLSRAIVSGMQAASGASRSVFTMHARRDLLGVFVQRAGADLGHNVARALARFRPAVAHADLRCDDRAIGDADRALRAVGFVFCGLLPGFAGCDVLRLQWLNPDAPIDLDPDLANPGARDLLGIIKTALVR